ncbi:hypothetical protein HNP46_005805 [Pseudomonas nitritireducens]|uniref:Uncharacterized protein n=1 Tax=Pseudomonas nitroreducens TaxID=46680 RepID=A0A7W7KRE9_PSENT|nr:hypothetical protein [Pseudomonas nitritireducens]MBB4866898.1 hypothetical protein [Pseudomonas nitritireducens]
MVQSVSCSGCGATSSDDRAQCLQCGSTLTASYTPEPAKGGNFISTHWNGDYSLARSYWVNGTLLTILLMFVMAVLFKALDGAPMGAMASAIVVTTFWVVLLAITIWQLVGIWRSASMHVPRGGRQIWALAACLMVVLGGFRTAHTYVTQALPAVKSKIMIAIGQDKIPEYRLTLLQDNTELEIAGGIPAGTAAAVEKALNEHPTVKILQVNSSGGLVEEAAYIGKLVRQRGLTTYTSSACMSACVLIFMSGQERLLGEKGRIGFHSAALVGSSGSDASSNEEFIKILRDHGASWQFIMKATSTKHDDMWFPDNAELRREHIVTRLVESRSYGTAAMTIWKDPMKVDHFLIKLPVYAAMLKYDPESYATMKAVLMQGAERGLSQAQITAEAARKIQEIIPVYMAKAPGPELVNYWTIQMREVDALVKIDPKACADFIFPGPNGQQVDIQRILPMALLKEDVAALEKMIEAASLRPQSNASTPQIQSDMTAAAVRLEKKHPGSLEFLEKGAANKNDPAKLCSTFSALYWEILAIPDPKRAGAVLRYMLSQS